jgi:phage FluMu protein Com
LEKNVSLIGDGLELLGLIDKARNADLYKQLGDWIDKVRILQIENDRLLTEQKELKEQLRFKGVLERINGHVFAQGDDEELCPRCAESDHKPVHLLRLSNKLPPYLKATCPQCKLVLDQNIPYTRDIALKRQLSPGIS